MEAIFVEMPETGECIVDVQKVVDGWNKWCFISQWHEEYTLVETDKDGEKIIKAKISKKQAHEIIGQKDLICHKSELFKNGSTWK